MKFTNVKQLIIKFMGGGLINFPTRFLRWVKINGNTDDSGDGGDGGGSDGGSSVDINTILDNISIKDDLLTKLRAIDYTNQGEDGILTDLTFDDVFNDYDDFIKSCLYREETPDITTIRFPRRISVVKDSHSLEVDIPDEDYISYNVFIIDEDNDIKIYVIKEQNSPI